MLGPFQSFPPGTVPELQVNKIGIIPKGHTPGKWRLITDLSSPIGASVNDGIETELSSLSYITVDNVAHLACQLGTGALLAKIDIESAYRLIPVHPADRPLQAIKWEGKIFIDPMLPFGLRSAPKIFNAVADAFQWHLRQQGLCNVLHYLDDYILIGPPHSPVCQEGLHTLLREASFLGIPIAEQKTEGPSTNITYLGIEIDTIRGELRLPITKLQRLRALLLEWGDRKTCARKELESLIGQLNHACKVIRPGRSFLRRMINLLHSRSSSPGSRLVPIRLNQQFRADLAWWTTFAIQWNGTSFLPLPPHLPTWYVFSDASGSWGCGAWFDRHWFQLQWSPPVADFQIAIKELIPILLGCAIWGRTWSTCRIIWHCDNQAVVACLHSRSSRDPVLMHLLRNLAFIESLYSFHLHAEYIDTHTNHIADDISRNNLSSFFLKVPRAYPSPSPIPRELPHLLLNQQASWISPHWRQLFINTLNKASPPQPTRPTV